ncbi:hypothetical protein FDP22_12625 [Paroceanicella profunda]|uniref:DUF6950 domain-containing protein n=1 Tax=Paroceanicella profunda TaxID=2579971 RepID=A0A5B8G0I1_9RHOB|nr:hypothetical protein [Paroceanicella profunda]QDL92552.1 hypothetical protein FDP22_12625 [Paroceanicella profunda]
MSGAPSPEAVQRAVSRVFSRRFAWGEADCCLAVADVLCALGLPDPAALWRLGYDRKWAEAALVGAGGLAALIGDVAKEQGWPRVCSPQPGDIGAGATLAICDGRRWWAKGARGMVAVPVPDVIWRVF